MAKFKFTIYSPYVGANVVEEVEIDDSELEGLSEEERHDYLNTVCKEWMEQTVEFGWEEVE
ncbi:DUF7167 family protein [Paenibacillus oleatilyticus]|uniref:DUF7167 domain-containing protein n=1 Tax=Paenibacillus oleatilyticus TaxID=2594886 RepID=A0ABV4VCB3_9BACL